jgi:putative PIG3 family NAD(P)H quinone oxidoreductase
LVVSENSDRILIMTIPTQTLAIEITAAGAAEVLKPTQRPLPDISNGQVLIKVAAAGVNYADVMQRQGSYPPPAGASDIPGLEVSGTIVAVAEDVSDWQIGDAVCALLSGGGYAEYCIADAGCVLAIPGGLSLIEAAALPETFFTVWSNIFDRAKLQAGETLLIHGGSSGIGSTAIQLGKAFGAKVIITAGSEEKCQFCQSLGADAVINYRAQDFVAEINTLTDGKGVDVILDIIGGDYFPRNLKCMGFDARLIHIALQNGIKSEINLLPVLLKRLTITGSTLRARDAAFKAQIAKQLQTQVWPLIASGQIKPIIHSIFPLVAAYKAHQLMESSQHLGKIILKV